MAVASYNIRPGESSSDTAYRRKLAEAMIKQGMSTDPIQHWTQGAARMLQSALGSYEIGKMEREDKAEREQGIGYYEKIADQLYGGGTAQPATIPGATPPNATRIPMSATNGKVYENDEPSPLDPPSGQDRDLAIRTVLAEAGNQGPTGMQAVGNVIRNRAVAGNFGGDTPAGVVSAPNQFEPRNTAAGRGRMAAIDPNSPKYQQAAQALEQAYAGNDPTGGATHFYAPKAQAALGRRPPKWDDGTGQPPVIVTRLSPWHERWDPDEARVPITGREQWPLFPMGAWKALCGEK